MCCRRLLPLLVISGLILVAPSGCRGLSQALDTYGEAAHEIWGFNGVIAVTQHGRVLLSRGYGYADTLFRDSNTPQTKFFIGSITKQFTAAAIMLLQQRGLLKLNDPITRYLHDYPHDPGDRIIIEQLLTHTSGLPNYTDFPETILNRTVDVTPSDIIASFRNRPLDFEPGTDFKYSNSGYILLGEIIEVVSGQSYEAFLHKELLKPQGMLNTGYGRREMGHPNRAEGYTIGPSGHLIGAVPIHFSILHSAGALYTTAEDMLKWDNALRDGRILLSASVSQMMSPHTNKYGFGWWIETRYGRTHTFHDGFLDGFNCTFDRWPEDSLAIVVFSNEDEAPVQKIARGLAAIVFGRKPVIPERKIAVDLKPGKLAEYVGLYQSTDGVDRYVVLVGDTLHTFLENQTPQHIFPVTADRFFFEGDNTETLTFRRDSFDKIIELDYSDGDDVWRLERSDNPIPTLLQGTEDSHDTSAASLGDYLGEYVLDADSTVSNDDPVIIVALCGDHLCAVSGENNPVILLGREGDRFYQPLSGFLVQFTRDSSNHVNGCVIELDGERVTGRRVSSSGQ